VQLKVILSIVEVGLQASAHLDAILWRHRDVASVKKRMQVAAEEQTVVDAMLTAL
jgi:hypothetical protein